MRRCTLAWICLLLAGACGKNSGRPNRSQEDGGRASDLACEAQREHVTSLYQAAADVEAVPAKMRTEFVASLVHMVMSDCSQSSRRVATCLGTSENVRDIETQCLLPLDDAGDAEAKRFATSP